MLGSDSVGMMHPGNVPTQELKIYGDEALMIRRDHMEVYDTVRNGIIQNMDHYEGLLRHCYSKIKVDPKDFSLLLANNLLHRTDREKLTEIIFEKLTIPNYFTIRNAVLSSFSAGRQSALVLDVGAYSTQAIPVHDGYALNKQALSLPFGGEHINRLLEIEYKSLVPRYLLDQHKQIINLPNTTSSFHDFHSQELYRDLKESTISFIDPQVTVPAENKTYELPDGQNMTITPKLMSDLTEIWFGQNVQVIRQIFPEIGAFKGVNSMLIDVINNSNTDMKSMLCNTILATGGPSVTNGFLQRLNTALLPMAPPMCKIKLVQYPSCQNRQHSVFLGGSILGSLSSFQSMWVGKQEYAESGYSIVERKCPM